VVFVVIGAVHVMVLEETAAVDESNTVFVNAPEVHHACFIIKSFRTSRIITGTFFSFVTSTSLAMVSNGTTGFEYGFVIVVLALAVIGYPK